MQRLQNHTRQNVHEAMVSSAIIWSVGRIFVRKEIILHIIYLPEIK